MAKFRPVSVVHDWAVLSALAVASALPFGLKARAETEARGQAGTLG
jgi:hypothetical protein